MASTHLLFLPAVLVLGFFFERTYSAPLSWLLVLFLYLLLLIPTSRPSLRFFTSSETISNSDQSETSLKAVFDICSDYLCVYQHKIMKICSKSMRCFFLPGEDENFWQKVLSKSEFADFEKAVKAAEEGLMQIMSVDIKRFADKNDQFPKIVPLSPILDSLQKLHQKESKIELTLTKIRYFNETAVLIKIDPLSHREHCVVDFAKTLNHEFRTPLNIIIGLSDLILADHPSEATNGRLRLMRQCAATFLATISSIVHQCEVLWSLPTSAIHSSFIPSRTIWIAVESMREKLAANGNHAEMFLSGMPPVLWGNPSQLRHALSFLLQSCSTLVNNQEIIVKIAAQTSNKKCEFTGELISDCQVQFSEVDFQSVLQLFSLPFDTEDNKYEYWTERLQKAESQSMLQLSIAREMCRLMFGDLKVIKTPKDTLRLEFSFCFSMEKDVILKRKGNIFQDVEEVLSIAETHIASPPIEESLLSSSPGSFPSKDRSDACLPSPESRGVESVPRKSKTIKNFGSSCCTWSWLAGKQETCISISKTTFPLQALWNNGDVDNPMSGEPTPRQSLPIALIADDVPSNALILQQMLKRLNVSSEIVSNGAEAVSYLQRFVPDVVFMDCEMPVMGGLQATRMIRCMGVSVPIIAVTANGPEKKGECLDAGMTHFLCKPVPFRTLEGLVETLQISSLLNRL